MPGTGQIHALMKNPISARTREAADVAPVALHLWASAGQGCCPQCRQGQAQPWFGFCFSITTA